MIAMLAEGMAKASKEIPEFSRLGADGQFFWGTIYYNAGETIARRELASHGPNYYQQPYSGSKKSSGRSAQYQALKRMAAMGYLMRTSQSVSAK